jgi:putative FmdB family regulatory protein
MTYEYHCPSCGKRFDVVKSHRDMERNENCVRCGEFAIRQFVPSKVHLIGTKVEDAEYNPGLGCIVRNKSHRKELCKQKGVEEIGNEKPDTLHKHFDEARAEKLEKAYDETTKGWVGNGGVDS